MVLVPANLALLPKLQDTRVNAEVLASCIVLAAGKNMTQVATTVAAGHFGPDHAVRSVQVVLHGVFRNRSMEAWPAGAGIKLVFR